MQREDLVDSTMGLLDNTFVPTTTRYLDVCHSLAESVGTQVRTDNGSVDRSSQYVVVQHLCVTTDSNFLTKVNENNNIGVY